MTDTSDADIVTPVCPDCGYDLRGLAATATRCPECGFDLTTIGPAISTVPWEHRREIGRLRALIATVWRFSVPYRWLRVEVARPVSIGDARRFWMIGAMLLSVLPITQLVITWHRYGLGFVFRDYVPAEQSVVSRMGVPGALVPDWITANFIFPWAVGVTRPGVLVVLIPLGILLCSGVHTYLFHPRGLHRRLADRAVALSYYSIAAFLLPGWLIGGLGLLSTLDPTWTDDFGRRGRIYGYRPDLLLYIVVEVLIVAALLRLPAALRLTTRCGWFYTGFATLAWPLMAATCAAAIFGIVPWAIGVAWMSITSMR